MLRAITRLGTEFFPQGKGSSYFKLLVAFVLLNGWCPADS